jgi:hypothetical protein
VVLGQSGVLGSALLSEAALGVAPDARRLVAEIEAGNTSRLEEILASHDAPQDWIYAAGLVDPALPLDELVRVNATVPAMLRDTLDRLARAMGHAPGHIRLVTLGTILEDRPIVNAVNSYARSKARLKAAFLGRPSHAHVAWAHVQLHTIYGRGRPHPFMFLGQIESALRNRHRFRMSSGRQLREYHHADDVARNICLYLAGTEPRDDCFHLSSGQPLQLGTLAQSIFDHFGLGRLLVLGVLQEQQGENYEARHERWPMLAVEREPLSGIIAWLEELGVLGELP